MFGSLATRLQPRDAGRVGRRPADPTFAEYPDRHVSALRVLNQLRTPWPDLEAITADGWPLSGPFGPTSSTPADGWPPPNWPCHNRTVEPRPGPSRPFLAGEARCSRGRRARSRAQPASGPASRRAPSRQPSPPRRPPYPRAVAGRSSSAVRPTARPAGRRTRRRSGPRGMWRRASRAAWYTPSAWRSLPAKIAVGRSLRRSSASPGRCPPRRGTPRG